MVSAISLNSPISTDTCTQYEQQLFENTYEKEEEHSKKNAEYYTQDCGTSLIMSDPDSYEGGGGSNNLV